MMDNLAGVFGTRMKSLEILFVLHGLKPVARQGFYDYEIREVEQFCKKNNLFFVKSEFKVMLADKDRPFSNKGIILSGNDEREGMYFVYISKDELQAQKAAYYEITQDHYNLGITLGYPACCSKFFHEQFPARSKLDNDYEIPVLENSTGNEFPFVVNIFLRHKDYCLLSHFPCSLECNKSIGLGMKNYGLLHSYDAEISYEFMTNLKSRINMHGHRMRFV